MAQTEQLRTYLMVSRDILGHQYRAWRSERVRWLPGCPEPGTLCTESRRDCRMETGTKVFPSGPPSGAGSVRVVALMSWSMFQMMGLTIRAGGRIGSGSVGESGECTRDRASALQFRFPGRYVMVKSNLVKNKAQRVCLGLSLFACRRYWIGDDSERMVCSLQPVPPLF